MLSCNDWTIKIWKREKESHLYYYYYFRFRVYFVQVQGQGKERKGKKRKETNLYTRYTLYKDKVFGNLSGTFGIPRYGMWGQY